MAKKAKDYTAYIDLMGKILDLRKRHAAPDNSLALTSEEEMVLAAIHTHALQKMSGAGVNTNEIERQWSDLLTKYGPKQVLSLYLEPPLFLGAPAIFLYYEITIGLLLLLTKTPHLTIIVAMFHLIGVAYFAIYKDKIRSAKINEILTQGIKE